MSRTFSRQSTEIRNSDTYADNLLLSNAETSAEFLEDDLNYIRSKLKDITGLANWYTEGPNGFNMETIREKRFTHWVQKFDAVTVPAGQNYVVLTGTEQPGDVMAINTTSLGVVVAQLTGATGNHALDVVDLTKNLCEIRAEDTNDVLRTISGYQMYGLLQVGSAATDGNAFADTGDDSVQLSFVYYDENDALAAVPIAEIEDLDIEYSYRKRTTFESLTEHAFDPTITFAESVGSMELPTSAKATHYTVANLNSGDTIALASFNNPDGMTFGVVAATWVRNYDVYISGMLMESGIDATADCDVYYVDANTLGLKRKVKSDSVIQVVQRK